MIETDIQRREFADGEQLAKGLAEWTAEHLRGAIAARGVALLIVSGGKSPARFFDLLSNLDLDWTRVADRKSTRLNSSHLTQSRMPSSA